MAEPPRTLTADRGDAGRRLDLVLRRHLADLDAATRTRVQSWIESGQVRVNGRAVRRVSARAALGDVVTVVLPDTPPRESMAAEDVGLRILYEDHHLLALDKPAGVVVHPAYKNVKGTVMNALLWHARARTGAQRPSIVGRLDKLTSGVVVVAKTATVHAALQRALNAGLPPSRPSRVGEPRGGSLDTNTSGGGSAGEKEYLAVVYGRVNVARGEIDLEIGHDRRDRRRMVAAADAGSSRAAGIRSGSTSRRAAGPSWATRRMASRGGSRLPIRCSRRRCGTFRDRRSTPGGSASRIRSRARGYSSRPPCLQTSRGCSPHAVLRRRHRDEPPLTPVRFSVRDSRSRPASGGGRGHLRRSLDAAAPEHDDHVGRDDRGWCVHAAGRQPSLGRIVLHGVRDVGRVLPREGRDRACARLAHRIRGVAARVGVEREIRRRGQRRLWRIVILYH